MKKRNIFTGEIEDTLDPDLAAKVNPTAYSDPRRSAEANTRVGRAVRPGEFFASGSQTGNNVMTNSPTAAAEMRKEPTPANPPAPQATAAMSSEIGRNIPSGANMHVQRRMLDPETGEIVTTSARWTHGNDTASAEAAAPVRRNLMQADSGLPPAPDPVPAERQMPSGEPGSATGSAYDQFLRRTDRAYDQVIGGARTNTDTSPVALADTKRFLERQRGNAAIRPDQRAVAERRLMTQEDSDRTAAGLASGERKALFAATGSAANANADLQGKQVMADAMRDQAATGAQGRVAVQGLRNEGAAAVEAERTTRAMVVKELANKGQIAVANTYALAGRDKAELAAETDKEIAKLNNAGKIEEAKVLAKMKLLVDPVMFASLPPDQQKQLQADIMAKNPEAGAAADPYSPTAAVAASTQGQDEQALIEAPDGSRRYVPRSTAQKYLDKGGKLIK